MPTRRADLPALMGIAARLTRLNARPAVAPAALCAVLAMLASGCYNPQRGAPADRLHYKHAILVRQDLSHVGIRTYVNRTHLTVGLQTEDLYDGDRDGALATDGMDRVAIADYVSVEDPPEAAVRRAGDLRNYDALFREILEAAREGKRSFKIESRSYSLQMYSEELNAPDRSPLLS